MYSGKKAQYDFPKMRGGGVKGRLELFQKFIRFGRAALPLLYTLFLGHPVQDYIFNHRMMVFLETMQQEFSSMSILLTGEKKL